MNSTGIYPWQHKQWQHFNTLRSTDHLPHALLLTGSDGIGKKAFSDQLASSLLCEQVTAEGYACGVCKSCKVKKSGAHPDYSKVDLPEGKQQIPVDAIRSLGEFLTLSRSYPTYRVVQIHAADKMNVHAANSLLKSLEEPPPQTVMILVADHMTRLPATIRSRCQLLHMTPPLEQQALDWLAQQTMQHSPKQMLAIADGKPLLALSLDQDESMLTERKKFAMQLLEVLYQHRSVTEMAKSWQKSDLNTLLDWQLKWLQSAIRYQALMDNNNQTPVNKFLQQIIDATRSTPSDRYESGLWSLYENLLRLKPMTDYPLNKQIFLESMLQSWRDIGTQGYPQ